MAPNCLVQSDTCQSEIDSVREVTSSRCKDFIKFVLAWIGLNVILFFVNGFVSIRYV